MPEGPSIVILKEAVNPFKGKKVLDATGNTKKIDLAELKGKTIRDFKSWGKHFLICFDQFTIRIHFLMFGSYLINQKKNTAPRLSLKFKNGEINFYSCSVRMITENLNDIYDWRSDVMNDRWDPALAKRKIKKEPERLVCDVLLDQEIFAGVGNIIKNEVLYRTKIHPSNYTGNLPARKVTELIREAVNYSFDFLAWKKQFILRKQWLVHTKKQCVVCNSHIVKQYLGKTNRRTFFCPTCQILYKGKWG